MLWSKIKTQGYNAEVRQGPGDTYLLVVRGPHLQRCIRVPKTLRSGRPGLDVVLDEVDRIVAEAEVSNDLPKM